MENHTDQDLPIKIKLTKQILSELNLIPTDQEFNKALTTWWFNPSQASSLRLTYSGYEKFKKANIAFYEIKFPEPIRLTNQLILWTHQFLKLPYYLKSEFIIVFDEKSALELILFNGDISLYFKAKTDSIHKLVKTNID